MESDVFNFCLFYLQVSLADCSYPYDVSAKIVNRNRKINRAMRANSVDQDLLHIPGPKLQKRARVVLKSGKILLRLDPSRRRRSSLEKKRKIEKGPEKSSYYDKLV